MSYNISGFGVSVTLIASKTFPVGLYLTEFADDADPIDIPLIQIMDTAMGLNGDLIGWTKANPIKISMNVIPGSFTDINLAILLEANRAGRGKVPARDIMTGIVLYPNNTPLYLNDGFITDGNPGSPVASSGRLKSKTYNFSFQGKTGGL